MSNLQLLCRGNGILASSSEVPVLNLNDLKAQCNRYILSSTTYTRL